MGFGASSPSFCVDLATAIPSHEGTQINLTSFETRGLISEQNGAASSPSAAWYALRAWALDRNEAPA
jgi:hypothetical protein